VTFAITNEAQFSKIERQQMCFISSPQAFVYRIVARNETRICLQLSLEQLLRGGDDGEMVCVLKLSILTGPGKRAPAGTHQTMSAQLRMTNVFDSFYGIGDLENAEDETAKYDFELDF